jgi:uncharacterized lipoprotein YbaY
MKKLLTLVALLAFGVSFVGCAESTPAKPTTPAPVVEKGAEEGAKPEGAAVTDEKTEEAPVAEEKKPE